MKALDQQMKRFNIPSQRFGELSYADIMEMSDFVHKGLEARALRAGHSPTPDDAQPLVERACTRLVSQMVKDDISDQVSTLGDNSGKDSPLMKALAQRAGERGIELEVQPEELGKLVDKFKAELTQTCLGDTDNLHPPTAKEAQTALAKAMNEYLDALAEVDNAKGLDNTQKAAVKRAIVSSPVCIPREWPRACARPSALPRPSRRCS